MASSNPKYAESNLFFDLALEHGSSLTPLPSWVDTNVLVYDAVRLGRCDVLSSCRVLGVTFPEITQGFRDLETLKWLQNNGVFRANNGSMDYAAYMDLTDCMTFLFNLSIPFETATLEAACDGGSCDAITHLLKCDYTPSPQCFEYLCRKGFASGIVALITAGFDVPSEHVALLARHRHLDCLQIMDLGGYVHRTTILCQAIASDSTQVLDHLLNKGFVVDSRAMGYATRFGNLYAMKCLHARGVSIEWEHIDNAAERPKDDCLRFALERSDPEVRVKACTTAIIHAAGRGSIPCLRLLLQFGFVADESVASYCAAYGHIPAMKFLRRAGMLCVTKKVVWMARVNQKAEESMEFLREFYPGVVAEEENDPIPTNTGGLKRRRCAGSVVEIE